MIENSTIKLKKLYKRNYLKSTYIFKKSQDNKNKSK